MKQWGEGGGGPSCELEAWFTCSNQIQVRIYIVI